MDIKKILNGIITFSGLVIGGYGLVKGISSIEPSKYSPEWIRKLSNTEWKIQRDIVQQKFNSPEYDIDTRNKFKLILDLFDKIKSERDWTGKTPSGPAYHREHGYGLYKKN